MQAAICPHCHKQLAKFPTRKGNCPFCQHTYYVRTDPDTHNKVVVDAKGVDRIEKIYQKRANEEQLLDGLKSCSDSFDDLYKAVEKDLTEKWMPKFGRGPGANDVLWGVAGKIVMEAAKNSDFNTMSRVYFEQALYIHNSGKDCHYLLKPCKDAEIRAIAKLGLNNIILMAKHCCNECSSLEGKKLSIQEALAQHLLPNPNCTYKLEENAPTGWCVCLYQASID